MSYTYTTLKSTLQSFTEDQGTAFETAIDLIIPLGEERCLRDLDFTIFDTIVTGALSANVALTNKPTDTLITRDFIVTTAAGTRIPLVQRDFSFLRDYWPVEGSTTTDPKYFAEYSATQWWIAGTPNAALGFSVRILKRPTGLSGSNATSWLGTYVGDLLLFACLISSEEFLKNTEQLQLWNAEYALRLSAALKEFAMLRRQDYSSIKGK